MFFISKKGGIFMNYETVNQALDAMHHLEETAAAYEHVMGVTYLDAASAAPKGSYEGRGKTIGVMSQIIYDLIANPENEELLSYLEENISELSAIDRRKVEALRKEYDQINKIPAEEYAAYEVLLNEAQAVWEQAKNNNDFASFAPYLEKIVAFNRKKAAYFHPEMQPYDALLNEYEEGLTMQTLDAFFAQLREVIVPLVAKIGQAAPVDDSFLKQNYPIDKQRLFSDYLMEVMGLDRNYCAIAESEHPFTINFNNKDVRITTHYHEDMVASSMYSVIHEGGHALYELGCGDEYNYSFLSGGVSMGIHESQSRFYENIIGRSLSFVKLIYPKLQELFPEQLGSVTAEQFYRAVNKAEPSLIRTEADDLTYTLHVMVRYEIEKQLIDGTLCVENVPAEWNRLYKEYLGVDVPNDTLGCLQDSHWSGGTIGYFPSYALGSAYGPQLLAVMEQEVGSVDKLIEEGNLSIVTRWLKEKIHRHASFHKPGYLFEMVCGKFDAAYYTDYLVKKYTDLYNL